MDAETFFAGWAAVARVVVTCVLAYAALVALLRISGKRTLSKMNAFDLVVTVALGSTLATILLSRDVALAEGLVAFALLIGLQYVVAWLSVRSATVSRLVKAEPALLLYRGALDVRDRASLAFFSATALPLVVAITTIAVKEGHMRSSTAASLVGAAVLSTAIYPLVALRLRGGRRAAPAMT